MNTTRIKLVLQAKEPDVPGWPHINFNYAGAAEKIRGALQRRMPEAVVDTVIYNEVEEARRDFEADRRNYDGIVLITSTNTPNVGLAYCDLCSSDFPIVIASLPHAGDGALLTIAERIRKERLPLSLVSSTDENDVAEAAQNIEVLKKMKSERILVITDHPGPQNEKASPAVLESAQKLFGCSAVVRGSERLRTFYESADKAQAALLAERWMTQAARVQEPSPQEILRSARLYCALEKMKQAEGCTAVTVDCLSLFYSGGMMAYPCLSFFEMANRGEVGVCEADIESVVTDLILLHGCARPGFVSDPVLDTSTGQIIYDHCVCTNKVFGSKDPRACDYYLRSHAEDRKGASVQTFLPVGEPVTTVKFSCLNRAFSVHSGVSVGNITLERGCRTKLAVRSEAEKILENWEMSVFGWHKVTVFGDWRKKLTDVARLKGLAIFEEDR